MENQSALSLQAPPGASLGSSSAGSETTVLQAHQVATNNGDFVLAGGNVNIHHNNNNTYPEPKLGISYLLRLVDNLRNIHLDILSKATPGTGVWLLKTDKFILWLDPNGELRIIWGTGLPGAGKSVMASLVINELEARAAAPGGSICVCYVYFRYSDVALSIRDILEILVKQTIERHANCASLAEETYARHLRENTQPTEAELLQLLQRFTGTKSATFYVLDALDEALDKLQLELVKKLASLNVRLFITSRPLKGVEDCISGVHSLRIVAQAQDLELHINKGIDISSNLQGLLKKAGPLLRDEIVASIKDNCDGMFLHASLQLDALSECMSSGEVRRTLKAFPSSIEDVYLQTWNRILKRNPSRVSLVKAVLLWVLNASRSLTIEELELAVATSSETYEFDPDKVVPGSTLIVVCRGLVTFEEESRVVRLVHYTAKATLQELLRDSFPHPHSHLAVICTTHVKKCHLNNSTLGSEEEFTAALRADPLLAYATAAWATHARQCLDVEDTRQRIATFVAESVAYPTIIQFDVYQYIDILRPLHIIAIYNLPISLITHNNIGDPNVTTHINQDTALMLASQLGHEDVVKALLPLSEMRINLVNDQGRSALMHAAYHGHEGVARLLLTHPEIQVNLVNEDGWPALFFAVLEGHRVVAALLLAHSEIPANLVSNEGWSALMLAARYGYTGIVTLLLARHEIQVNLVNKWGCSALMLAARDGRTDIVTLLLARPEIQVYLVSNEGSSALMLAASYGHTGIVTLLLARREIQVNLVDNWGCSALMLAARDGRTDIVTLLLARHEIQINLANNDGRSALMLAARNGRTDIVTLLLACPEIQVNVVNNEGCSALMLAERYGYEGTVKHLLARPDIQVNLVNKWGYSALMLAARDGRTYIVTLLLAHPEVQVNLVNNWGCSALMLAARDGRTDIVTLLLAHPEIQVNLVDNEGCSALMLAVEVGHKDIVTFLLARPEIQVNLVDLWGCSALMLAARDGCTDIVTLLLAHPEIQINLVNDNGCSALMLAAEMGHESIIRAFLDVPHLETSTRSMVDERMAVSIALAEGHLGIIQLLQELELPQKVLDSNSKNYLGVKTDVDLTPLPFEDTVDKEEGSGYDSDGSVIYYDAEDLLGYACIPP